MTADASQRPIIVTADLAAPDQSWADTLRRRYFPPQFNRLPAHLTLFHHLPPSCEAELRALLGQLAARPAPAASAEGLLSLGRGVAIRIVSPQLMAVRDVIAERFQGLLIPQDQARPRLHITVQNKVDPTLARETLHALEKSEAPRPVRIAALACWFYCGGPWEPIARYPFRG